MSNWPKEKCTSGLDHGIDIEGGMLHYFGCLEFKKRQKFFDSLPADQQRLKKTILEETARIQKSRALFEKDGQNTKYGKLLSKFKIAQQMRKKRNPLHGPPRIDPPPAASSTSPRPTTAPKTPTADVVDLGDLNANVIYFKNHAPYTHPRFKESGNFPNQKVPLGLLLKKDQERNPLMWKCEEGMIRYFHVPANNMAWIEEIIARYYSEDKPDLDGPYRKPQGGELESKTRMLLRPQFWRGLQHGNRVDLPTHTRHMRPRCYVISTDSKKTEIKPKNIVLFMPYLHWETDRRRARAADVIKRTSHAKMSAMDDVVDATAISEIEGLFERATSDGLVYNISTTTRRSRRKQATGRITNSTIQGQKLLGSILFHAAALYEAMDGLTDEKLIETYLMATPSLHPRRTLDQSYYWTLKDTRKRDRDQVVYRGTAPVSKLMHHRCFKGEKGNKTYRQALQDGSVQAACKQCQEDIRRVPRVVMVDQLWMWVLDENTIITSFPKRWGRNKPDPSAIQKRIRTRIQAARDDEIRTVYDLGIIIIDQCSRVFFDRTQSIDLQPQVMDNFGNAIGKVSHKTTIAFDHFWDFTRLTSKKYNAHEDGEPETRTVQNMQKTLLDINPEGQLLREIKDIMDELFIMTQIKNQEESVARTYMKLVKNILHPSLSSGDNIGRNRSDLSLPETGVKRSSLTVDQHRPTFHELFEGEGDADFSSTLATDLTDSFADQLQELGYLKAAGERTEAALKDLMELKQQQAGVMEAREAVKQGEESLKQGRSIMLFTVVTIIFLPLSFFATIFGMNATELTGQTDGFKFRDIFRYMIPISFVMITTSLFLAFSKLTRAVLSFAFNYAWAWIITRSPIYVLWHDVRWHDKHVSSKTLNEQEKLLIDKMKADALRKQRERKIKREEDEKAVRQEGMRNPTSIAGRAENVRMAQKRRKHGGGVRNGTVVEMQSARIHATS